MTCSRRSGDADGAGRRPSSIKDERGRVSRLIDAGRGRARQEPRSPGGNVTAASPTRSRCAPRSTRCARSTPEDEAGRPDLEERRPCGRGPRQDCEGLAQRGRPPPPRSPRSRTRRRLRRRRSHCRSVVRSGFLAARRRSARCLRSSRSRAGEDSVLVRPATPSTAGGIVAGATTIASAFSGREDRAGILQAQADDALSSSPARQRLRSA